MEESADRQLMSCLWLQTYVCMRPLTCKSKSVFFSPFISVPKSFTSSFLFLFLTSSDSFLYPVVSSVLTELARE